MGFVEELKSGNFSLYGQYWSLLSGVLLIVLGAVTLISHIVYSILAICFGALCFVIEFSWILKICPTSPWFDKVVEKLKNHWLRFLFYLVFAAVMWSSLAKGGGILAIGAATITVAAACYCIAAVKNQASRSIGVLSPSNIAKTGGNAYMGMV
ncbi:Golgi apparatus membrane protein tvp18 [Coemansia sp. RSA 1722]|nr:Golgi apparatus membrane protein tvp18 [Coemansia sp. RSA 485]KAJ2593393.1 Golgi apparatus membrane protein tvp18 [Coemansia sp. RSA 1722]KAJ2597164.1 Golgi apparatus membrane protein tvp18 [Coemansia sp. RSA 1722]KAJ2599507.1 Golgi apparatus membrane protein tvp18 [Coemansia sp. RSA 1721]KAJ2702247.1 Golgi apparatus membrane protein tvp18 [Coemansia sp. IMI 203386]